MGVSSWHSSSILSRIAVWAIRDEFFKILCDVNNGEKLVLHADYFPRLKLTEDVFPCEKDKQLRLCFRVEKIQKQNINEDLRKTR